MFRHIELSGELSTVISFKEKSVEVVYRDEFQVAVRPKKKKQIALDPF